MDNKSKHLNRAYYVLDTFPIALHALFHVFHPIILGGGYSDLQFADEQTEAPKVKKLAQDPTAHKRQS